MVDVRRAVVGRVDSLLAKVLDPLRPGPRTIHMTPERGIGPGNFLYLLFDAHRRQAAGRQYFVLATAPMDRWVAAAPPLGDLCVRPSDVRFVDRRERWAFRLAAAFDVDFTASELEDFVTQRMGAFVDPAAPEDELVVNVRRGDFYSDPYVRGRHGFDIPAYLELALEEAQSYDAIQSVVVVSDGIDWCRRRLDHLIRRFTPSVTYVPASESPLDNFRRVASARRLIGTNSTFSYWGGYVSTVMHGSDSHVIMPWFHARRPEGIRAEQLHPAWTVVRDIPGGWNS